MRRSMLGLLSAAVVAASAACVFADVYTDGNLTVDWTRSADAYTGKLTLGAQQFPATAHDVGDAIDGSFQSNGTAFPFTAKLQADTLTLTTGGKTYTLKSQGPANPLTGVAPASAGTAPAGYTVMTHTDAGQALSTTKAGAKSVQEALRAALTDLDTYFDAKPNVGGAYEDSQTHKTGGAAFTATLKGQPVHGIMSTKLDDQGASVAVVYCRTDASADEWKKLNTPPPSPQDVAEAAVNLTTYNFPDGTGSIGLADGWTTDAQSDLDRIFIKGPADQHLAIGASFSVLTPDAPLVKMMEQTAARSRQMGFAPPPPPPMLIAPYSPPGDALRSLVPQLSQMNERNGGPSLRLDQIIDEKPAPPMISSGKASIVQYLITRDDHHGKSIQVRNVSRIECDSFGNGYWSIVMIELSAPVDSFDRDRTPMLAMLHSQKENTEVCQRIMAQRQQASQQQLQQQAKTFQQQQDQRFADSQAAHQQQMAGYAAHNEQWARDENAKARSADNFTEMVGGYRTVIDTQTGEKASIDYYNVNGIVNGLNTAANDPNRFVQIPLRDEKDPIVGQ